MFKKSTLLVKDRILQEVNNENFNLLDEINIIEITKSTNLDAKNSFRKNQNSISAFFAEQQTAGKGRNNRRWISPFGKNLYFSLAWRSKVAAARLQGLSLAVAVEVSKSLNKFSSENIKIKWPNDLFIHDKKLGGILIESSSSTKNQTEVVIGIGINIYMTREEGKNIDQNWVSLNSYLKKKTDRNKVAGSILDRMIRLTVDFPNTGIGAYVKQFETINILKNKECRVIAQNNLILEGVVKGINKKGELLLKVKNDIYNLTYGEVTIRKINS